MGLHTDQIDAEIARRIFGYEHITIGIPPTGRGPMAFRFMGPPGQEWVAIDKYSTGIEEAFDVVEKMKSLEWEFCMDYHTGHDNYQVRFIKGHGIQKTEAGYTHSSPAMAICQAALLAVSAGCQHVKRCIAICEEYKDRDGQPQYNKFCPDCGEKL